jgi:hypothetical protein
MIRIVSDQIFSMNKGNISAKGMHYRKTEWRYVLCLFKIPAVLFNQGCYSLNACVYKCKTT